MDKNYYEILGLKRDALAEEVAESYKKMVLRWHPKFAKEDQNTAYYHFSQISEAYEVLSDPIKRAFYDKHGWKKLKEGLFSQGQLKGGYRFGNNPDEIFEKFFHSNNTFAQVFDKSITEKGSMFSHAFGSLNYKEEHKNNDLVVMVPCSLSELYLGVAKKVSYERNVLNLDGRTLSMRREEKLLEIKPGYGKKTMLRFKEEGHETIERKKSDLIFQIGEIRHPSYARNGINLIYTAPITLAQAISCEPLEITTLDNRKLRVSLDEIPNPSSVKEVIGQGMPIQDSRAKGNLYIKFNISFPKNLSVETKAELHELLK